MSEALRREMRAAALEDRPVRHIRITEDALRGSPVALPITPERQRTVGRLRAYPGGGVDADLAMACWELEIVVHPVDWYGVLAATALTGELADDLATGVRFWCGVPVLAR